MTGRRPRRSRALEARPAGRVSVRAIVLLALVALVVLTIDQLAKWWVVTNLPFRVPRNVVGTLLIFQYDRNPGAAFSIGTGSTWIFSIVAVAVLVFVIWYARRIRSIVWAIVFGLVLGGLLGNLTDRLFRPPGFGVGEVVDFLRIPLLPAIFNLADSAIVLAMVLFLVLTVMGVGLDGKRAVKQPARPDAGDESAGGHVESDAAGTQGDGQPSTETSDSPATEKPAPAADDGNERPETHDARFDDVRHPVDGRA